MEENKEKLRKCKYCKSEIKINTGVQNWKNLFRRPTLEEGIILFIILMMIISSYAYTSDLNNIINYYENETYCSQKYAQEQNMNQLPNVLNNLITYNSSNLSINEDG
jgi:hypothetical protein